MRNNIKSIISVAIVFVVSAMLLVFVNSKTSVMLQNSASGADFEENSAVIKEADAFENVELPTDEAFSGIQSVFAAKKGDDIIGYAIKSSVKGFGGDIISLTGVLANGDIEAFQVLEHTESPGIGERIVEPEFQDQFSNYSGEVALDSDGGAISALSGATVSSKAAVEAVKLAQNYVLGLNG